MKTKSKMRRHSEDVLAIRESIEIIDFSKLGSYEELLKELSKENSLNYLELPVKLSEWFPGENKLLNSHYVDNDDFFLNEREYIKSILTKGFQPSKTPGKKIDSIIHNCMMSSELGKKWANYTTTQFNSSVGSIQYINKAVMNNDMSLLKDVNLFNYYSIFLGKSEKEELIIISKAQADMSLNIYSSSSVKEALLILQKHLLPNLNLNGTIKSIHSSSEESLFSIDDFNSFMMELEKKGLDSSNILVDLYRDVFVNSRINNSLFARLNVDGNILFTIGKFDHPISYANILDEFNANSINIDLSSHISKNVFDFINTGILSKAFGLTDMKKKGDSLFFISNPIIDLFYKVQYHNNKKEVLMEYIMSRKLKLVDFNKISYSRYGIQDECFLPMDFDIRNFSSYFKLLLDDPKKDT